MSLQKLIIVGDEKSGKSCILHRFIEAKFNEVYDPTIGVEFASRLFVVGDNSFKLQIWDAAGQEAYTSIVKSYYKGAKGIILVFSVDQKETFENLPKWMNQIQEYAGQNVPVIILGNKCDIPNRNVSFEEAKAFADKVGAIYIDVSAKSGDGIDEAFEKLGQKLVLNE